MRKLYGEVLATRRKSAAPLYRQLSLDYLRGSPLLPVEFRNGCVRQPDRRPRAAGSSRRAPSSATA